MTRMQTQPLPLIPLPLGVRQQGQTLDPLSAASLRANRRGIQPPPLPPEQERSLLESGLGLLEVIGRTLDKPGSAARGTIHGLTDMAQGDPTPEWGGGLLNLMPFSDTLGVTDPNARVSGRDLLENVGFAPKNKPGLFNSLEDAAWDVAGFGTEVVSDPLFWMSGPLGTLTKQGQAAKAASAGKQLSGSENFAKAVSQAQGVMDPAAAMVKDIEAPSSLIEGLKSGDRSILGFKAPFAKDAAFSLADLPGGKQVDQFAANALQALHYGLGDPITQKLSAPMRGLRAAFDISAQAKVRTPEQWLADKSWGTYRKLNGMWQDFAPVAAAREGELMGMFKEIADHTAAMGDENAFNKTARYLHEMPYFKDVADVKSELDGVLNLKGATPEVQAMADGLSGKWYEYIEGMRGVKDKVYDELQELGYAGPKLEMREIFGSHGRRRSTNIKSNLESREELFVNTPGMTKSWIEMSMDPLITAPNVRDVSTVAGFTPPTPGTVGIGSYVRPADRMNEGRVTSIDQATGTANVYFHNKQTGVTATKQFMLSQLSPVMKDGAPVFKPITQKQLVVELQNALSNNVDPITRQHTPIFWSSKDKLDDLQKKYVWEGKLKPELEYARNEELVNVTDPKLIQDINAKYDKVENEWLNGYDVTDNKGVVTHHPPKLEQAIGYLGAQPAEMRSNGLFPRQILEDQHDYMRQTFTHLATMREVHKFLTEPGVLDSMGASAIPLSKAWKDAGYTDKGLQKFLADNPNIPTTTGISEKAASTLKAYQQVLEPRNTKQFIGLLDPVINAYKFGLTAPFPSFSVRNRLSGIWMALAEGNVNPAELNKGSGAVARHMAGKGSLDPGFLEFLKQSDLLKGSMGLEFGQPRQAGLPEQGLIEGITDPIRGFFKSSWKEKKQKLNPRNIAGLRKPVEGAEFSQNVLSEITGNVVNYVESLNRAGYAKALWDKGYAPSDIINYVRRTQFDYGELSAFEQNVMKRAVPFWTFTKKNVPYQLKKLAEQPGGPTAQTIRAMSGGDDDEAYTPSFLKERLGIRGPQNIPSWLGGEKDPNETTFITQTGITPVEELNKFVYDPGGWGLINRRNMQKMAANLHPLAVAALRQYSGTDPFTGRDLKNLHSPTDAVLNPMGTALPDSVKGLVDRGIQASPFSRAVSEAGGLLDARKSWPERIADFGSGLDLATYDVELERARDLAKAQAKVAERYPNVFEYTRHFVPKDATGKAADEARQAVGILNQIEKLKREAQAKNKAGKKQKAPATDSWGGWPS